MGSLVCALRLRPLYHSCNRIRLTVSNSRPHLSSTSFLCYLSRTQHTHSIARGIIGSSKRRWRLRQRLRLHVGCESIRRLCLRRLYASFVKSLILRMYSLEYIQMLGKMFGKFQSGIQLHCVWRCIVSSAPDMSWSIGFSCQQLRTMLDLALQSLYRWCWLPFFPSNLPYYREVSRSNQKIRPWFTKKCSTNTIRNMSTLVLGL